VGVEVKAQVGRKVRQPEHGGLQPDQPARVEQLVEARHAALGRAEFLEAHAQIQAAVQALDDEARRHAIRDQRQAVQADERQVGERQRRGEAEGHRLGHRQAAVAHQRGHHARLAMRGVHVHESLRHRYSTLSSASSGMPSASA
jgi:hypothetical protein